MKVLKVDRKSPSPSDPAVITVLISRLKSATSYINESPDYAKERKFVYYMYKVFGVKFCLKYSFSSVFVL